MLPIASQVALRAVRQVTASALPDAPVVPDPPRRHSALRRRIAAFLRASARGQIRLAERIDRSTGVASPAT